MRRIVLASCLAFAAGLALAALPAGAAEATPQQYKMKTCNKEAAGKKGDERKKFMSACLKK
jgi:hypothetical protein